MKFAKLNKTGDNLVLQITPYCQTDTGVIPSISNNIKTHDSESRGQEEAGRTRDEQVSYLHVAPL